MLKYTFFNSKLSPNTLEEALELVRTTDKPFKYTYGLGYRHPTTDHVPITREVAIKTVMDGGLLDVTEYEDYIHLNNYSANDMW